MIGGWLQHGLGEAPFGWGGSGSGHSGNRTFGPDPGPGLEGACLEYWMRRGKLAVACPYSERLGSVLFSTCPLLVSYVFKSGKKRRSLRIGKSNADGGVQGLKKNLP